MFKSTGSATEASGTIAETTETKGPLYKRAINNSNIAVLLPDGSAMESGETRVMHISEISAMQPNVPKDLSFEDT